ncbi:spore germination protein [Psychrobacillus sp. NPDC096389]|uniref:spore germination protein n=1 Tax=Psychrobacillus sp. NPDC096389 TaxID=3364490 RepID=UPI003803611D
MLQLTDILKEEFSQTFDFVAKDLAWKNESVILCYYSTMIDTPVVMEQIRIIQERYEAGEVGWGLTAFTEESNWTMKQLKESVCSGETVLIFPRENKLIRIILPKTVSRNPESPANEYVVRGAHEAFVENAEVNINLLRKRLKSTELRIDKRIIGTKSNTPVSILYLTTKVDQETLKNLMDRLDKIDVEMIYSSGQLEDYLEDSIWSPFPQFINTERPDRVVANLMEGKIAIISDADPTVLIAPINLFSFYESPDDFNGRVLVGTFYRLVRLACFFMAIFLPAFYIAVVSFHFEIMPIDLGEQVRSSVANVPFRPIFEAMLLELLIELIREASIRLPSPIGQTIGVVGGLVIGDAIVSAGLASNLMVIVVASTALASFVVPSVEMNTTIRILRFPFMVAASLFGFFGIVIGSLILFIHLLNLQSLNHPYLSPLVPFEPKKIKSIFFRLPYYKQIPERNGFYLFSKKGPKKNG